MSKKQNKSGQEKKRKEEEHEKKCMEKNLKSFELF
jgi:hypothetical protein